MCENKMNPQRRAWLLATAAAGGGFAVTTLVPFVASMTPSERARAAGAPVEVDIGNLAPGQLLVVEWRGKPVWILRRTEEMLATLGKLSDQLVDPESKQRQQPEYCRNPQRAIRPEYLVAIGICTHLGCSPSNKFKPSSEEGMPADWLGGFLCPCHGSTFDLAGRVFKNKPAPTNLEIPPHRYLSDTRLLIGEDGTG
ncbi:ubiquinol-cytochrome c reductase iron-sulfur subunit [Denitratisoma sp. agr-D3]